VASINNFGWISLFGGYHKKMISAQHWTQPKSGFLAKISHVHLQLGYHNKNQGQVKTSQSHLFLLSNGSPCKQTFFFNFKNNGNVWLLSWQICATMGDQ
jgi:hypothetical protein